MIGETQLRQKHKAPYLAMHALTLYSFKFSYFIPFVGRDFQLLDLYSIYYFRIDLET